MSGSPPVLGFISADLYNGASSILWPSIVEEARRRGANLVCFPGGRLGGSVPEAALRNRVYDLAGGGCVEGVITWASSLGGAVEGEALEAFHQRWRGLPLVSLSHKLEDAPVIWIDAYSGMKELINHLVEVHGFRKIAFVRGPSGHQSAQRRFRAYLDALAEHGIEADPDLITEPLPWDSGARAVDVLVTERALVPGQDFQALASASDLLSFGSFTALKSRGVRIPQDVVLVGFNGTVESVLSQPHLTTVALPFQEQGVAAVERVIDLLKGIREEDMSLATRLLIRESCGCPSRTAQLAQGSALPGRTLEDACLQWLRGVASLGDFNEEALAQWFSPLGTALVRDLQAGTARLPALVNQCLEQAAQGSHLLEWTPWHDALSLMRSGFSNALGVERAHLDSVVDQCRIVVSAFSQQQATAQSWEEGRRAELLREIGRTLSAAWTVAELGQALDSVLPLLDIPAAWLVLTSPGPRLVWSSGAPVPAEGLEVPEGGLLPQAWWPAAGPYCLVVEPLYFQDRSVGYAVFQTGPLEGAVYEELRSDLSSALKGIFLVEEARTARLAAEKADQIKTRLLANVSHELRTPLTQILGHVEAAGQGGGRELERIKHSAEHQLRLINDLLDLSRAEIDELDLARTVLDPAQLLAEVFEDTAPRGGRVAWKLVSERLPFLQADPVRLKQVFLNLLSNAARFTTEGSIELGARSEPPHLHFWVKDTGTGIATQVRDRIFQPFVTGDHDSGIGLGLSITRHLVALHYGTLAWETQEGKGTTFHVRLPLPNLENSVVPESGNRQNVVVLLSRSGTVPAELDEWVKREGLEVVLLDSGTGPELGLHPRCLCWDLNGAQPRDWALVRQLRHHPGLFQAPFLLYGDQGMTSLVDKAGSDASLRLAIEASCPPGGTRPVYIIDDEQQGRQSALEVVEATLPGYPVRLFNDGPSAWQAMAEEVPSLIVLDFSMPGWDGAEVLDRVREDQRLRLVPVLLLSHKVFTTEDIRRIERHTQVTLQTKGIWDNAETGDAVRRLLAGADLPVQTSALVKRALAFMAGHYQQPLSRWQVAEAVNVSEDYLSRVFSRELNLSPWDFLTRYRLHQACRLLTGTNESIRTIAQQVGFNDQAYFSRVFRKSLQCTPQEYRAGGPSLKSPKGGHHNPVPPG